MMNATWFLDQGPARVVDSCLCVLIGAVPGRSPDVT